MNPDELLDAASQFAIFPKNGEVWDTTYVERTHWPHMNAGPFTPPHDWAIRRQGRCLNREGEWEWEPLPSSREQDFLARCRFDRDEAIALARAALEGRKPVSVSPLREAGGSQDAS